MENNKKKLQIPSTCALLFMLMIVCAILTWIVPAGEFDTEKVGDLNKVIAGTYHTVEASPVGPWATIMAVVQGFYKAAKLMVMVMFVGGAVEVLEKLPACIYRRLFRIQRRLGERLHYRYCTADRGAPDLLRFQCPCRIKHHQLRDLLFLYDPLHENHQGGSEEELKL